MGDYGGGAYAKSVGDLFFYKAFCQQGEDLYVLNWSLSTMLDAYFCVEALRQALVIARPEICNTDQGSQFASDGFIGVLKEVGITISMDDRGRVFDNTGKDVPLMDISPRHAESFIAARLASRVRIGTANKDIRTLRRVLSLAAEPRGYLPVGQNPFAKVRERKVSLKPVSYVSVQELQTVLRLVQHTWWQTRMILAYCSGDRRNELLNLTWADIDFEQRNVCFSSKEASEELLAWEPKDHEIRVIPIPEQAVQFLTDMQNQAEEGSPYVLIQKERLAPILSRWEKGTWNVKRDLINNLMRDLEVMCCCAGVKRFTLHDLRRSCITNWAQVLPIHVVQKLTDHSDIKTTQRYYLAVRESDMERARQFQSEILGAGLTGPKLTHSGQKQCSQRKCLQDGGL